MDRYDRHIKLLGEKGFADIRKGRVLLVGVGGLGSIVGYYLAGSGIGEIILVDKDKVDITNLNRQILYAEEDVGKPKAIVAKERLSSFNKDLVVQAYVMDVFDDGFEDLVKRADIIVDGLDNWDARLRVNELAVKYSKPFVHAAINEWYGHLFTVLPGKGPCLHCLFSNVKARERREVLPPLPGVVGSLEVAEVIKYLTGIGHLLYDRMLHIDIKQGFFSEIKIKRNPQCPVCSGLK